MGLGLDDRVGIRGRQKQNMRRVPHVDYLIVSLSMLELVSSLKVEALKQTDEIV